MEKLNLFIPLSKVNEADRTVSGVLSAEVVDKSGEIMDYASGKAQFEKWSKEAHKRSGGKSLGNIREMHDNKACGKLTQLDCNDATKSIHGTAKIVDDAAWEKVMEGVYTGFSIGGEYARKWDDPDQPNVKRFEPVLAEVSIVDNPCVAEAVFELTRADGSTEMRKFKTVIDARNDKTLPLNKRFAGVTPPEQSQKWLAKDGSEHKSKEEAFAHNANLEDPALQLLNKMNATLDKLESQPDPMDLGKKDFSDEQRKKLADEGKALPDGSFPIESVQDLKNAIHAFGRASDKPKAKAHIIARAKALGEESLLPENWHKDGKGEHTDDGTEKSFKSAKIKKGLHEVARAACLIQELEWLCGCVEWEQAAENDTESNQPDELKHIITTLCSWLKDACEEECDEITEPHAVDLMTMAAGLPEDHARAMSKVVSDFQPFDTEELKKDENKKKVQKLIEFKKALEKAGARHSKADMEVIGKLQSKHEEMGEHMDKMKKALNEVDDAHGDIHMTHRAMGKCMGKSEDGKMEAMKEKHEEMGGYIKKAMASHRDAEDAHADMEDTHQEMGKCMGGLMSSEKAIAATMQKNTTDETALLKADNEKQKDTIAKLTEGLGAALKRIETIERQPQAAKGVLYAVPKGHEREPGNAPDETAASEPDRPYKNRI